MAIITGSDARDRLIGTDSYDLIVGELGNDVLFGMDGGDVLQGDRNDEGNPFPGGNDRLVGGNGNDVLLGGVGDDVLDGGDGDDFLMGGDATGFLYETGGTAFSYPQYGPPPGADDYIGGAGTDFAWLIYNDLIPITIDASDPNATTAILRDGVAAGSISGIEYLTFVGGGAGDHVTAARIAEPFQRDYLNGRGGDDVLDGGGGGDILNGGLGDDTLIGGEGSDNVAYEFEVSGPIRVDLRIQGVAQDTGGAGFDTLIGIEGVEGSLFRDIVTGDDGANELIDRYNGNDRLSGGDGDDAIRVERYVRPQSSTVQLLGEDGDDRIDFYSDMRFEHRALLSGGAGDDAIGAIGLAHGTVRAGNGRDVVTVETLYGEQTISLGGGRDTLRLLDRSDGFRAEGAIVVTDFATGLRGDAVDLGAWLKTALIDFEEGSDPFAAHLKIAADGPDAILYADRDGAGTAYDFAPLIVFQKTDAGAFVAENFTGFDGAAVSAASLRHAELPGAFDLIV